MGWVGEGHVAPPLSPHPCESRLSPERKKRIKQGRKQQRFALLTRRIPGRRDESHARRVKENPVGCTATAADASNCLQIEAEGREGGGKCAQTCQGAEPPLHYNSQHALS